MRVPLNFYIPIFNKISYVENLFLIFKSNCSDRLKKGDWYKFNGLLVKDVKDFLSITCSII